MYNEASVKKARQKIGLYFIDLVKWNTHTLGVREIHRKYKVSPQVIERNLWHSYFLFEGNRKKVYLTKERKKEVQKFLKLWKIILENENKKLNEILFYTLNEVKWSLKQ